MLFNSIHFLAFFPIVVGLFFACRSKYRWLLLLVASYYFYMAWKPGYAALIAISTWIDYWAAMKMGKRESKHERRPYLWLSIIVNLGLLMAFKYAGFFALNLNDLLGGWQVDFSFPVPDWLLPVGISFYTFQTLAYSIDVYRGKIAPERHLGKYALYVAYFPQLVAGPIERAARLLPQLTQLDARWDWARVLSGCQKMAWGFFKKMVIADRLAIYVDQVYASPESFSGPNQLLATYFFAFQIYCDFSGYSDIAIGASRVLGVRLMENFRFPYFSLNIREFWTRWHISLSTWFKDYLYIPLGGNRVKTSRMYFNILVVFLVSGFWHGANWTFIAWGAAHALLFLLHHITQQFFPAEKSGWGWAIASRLFTFHWVILAWVFFRADSLPQALSVIQDILVMKDPATFQLSVGNFGAFSLLLSMVFTGLLLVVDGLIYSNHPWLSNQWLRLIGVGLLLSAIIMFGVNEAQTFIYFQF